MRCALSARLPQTFADAREAAKARLRILADPQRMRIIELLAHGEHCVCELTTALGLPQNTVSHHLSVLRSAGVIISRRKPTDRRWVYYRLQPETLNEVAELLREWAAHAQMAPLRVPICPPSP